MVALGPRLVGLSPFLLVCLYFTGVYAVLVPVALWVTPVTDIGMMSTFVVFLLFGVFGLWLWKTQKAEAN